MTSVERECMEYLCKRIAGEKDPEVFAKLAEELNDVLELQYRRIHPEHSRTTLLCRLVQRRRRVF